MAISSTLPIYKETYQLSLLATEITRHMPRDLRRDLGGKIREECFKLVLRIYRANTAANKVPDLSKLLERLEVVNLLFRLSRDLRAISIAQYARAIELTGSIGKQANGWRKSSAKSPAA